MKEVAEVASLRTQGNQSLQLDTQITKAVHSEASILFLHSSLQMRHFGSFITADHTICGYRHRPRRCAGFTDHNHEKVQYILTLIDLYKMHSSYLAHSFSWQASFSPKRAFGAVIANRHPTCGVTWPAKPQLILCHSIRSRRPSG